MKINPKLIALVIAHYPENEGAEILGLTEREFSNMLNMELKNRGYGFTWERNRQEELREISTALPSKTEKSFSIEEPELAVQFHFDSQLWDNPRSLIFCREEDEELANTAASYFRCASPHNRCQVIIHGQGGWKNLFFLRKVKCPALFFECFDSTEDVVMDILKEEGGRKRLVNTFADAFCQFIDDYNKVRGGQ